LTNILVSPDDDNAGAAAVQLEDLTNKDEDGNAAFLAEDAAFIFIDLRCTTL
jgi:predicted ABC-type transport system involved in lysophospholipase L1 biosynthesis ATPase subunit